MEGGFFFGYLPLLLLPFTELFHQPPPLSLFIQKKKAYGPPYLASCRSFKAGSGLQPAGIQEIGILIHQITTVHSSHEFS